MSDRPPGNSSADVFLPVRNVETPANFRGEVARTIATRHFSVSEVIEVADIAHVHAAPWLWLCDAETAILHAANTTHFGEPCHEARSIVVQSVSAEAGRTIEELSRGKRLFRDARLRPLCLRIRRELHDCDDASEIAVDGAVFLLLAELSRLTAPVRTAPKSPLVSQLEASLDAGPEGELIAQLASHNQISTRTYLRRIRLETGLSATQYLSQLRAERAKTLLRTTSLSVLEIALRLGYCDRSHFARAFSRAVGMTPSQYRASLV